MEAKITWIFLFIILYWGYSIFWGVQGASRARTATDYFIAGRRLSLWVFVLAATATSFSGWTFIGHPGLTFVDGLQYSFASLYAIAIPFTGVLFLKRQWLLGRHFGFITPGEMLAYYFRSDVIRILVLLVALFFSVPYVGVQFRASGFLFNVLTDGMISVEIGMWMLASVTISYVATGGLRTVAHADTLQAVLIAVGMVIIGIIVLVLVGGWDRLLDGIAALAVGDPVRTPQGYSHYVAVPGVIQWVADGTEAVGGAWTGVMILTYIFGLMGIQASPAFSMWAFAARSPAPFAFQQVWASSFVIGLILVVFTVIQGMGGHLLGADLELQIQHPDLVAPVMTEALEGQDLMAAPGRQDILVPQLINLVGQSAPWLVGLLAVCALAAMESTAACYMCTAGGMITRDLIKRFLLPGAGDATQKFLGRISIVLVVILALIVATTSSDALVLLGGMAVSYGLQMWPALIAACFWPFLTRQGVALGLAAGLVAVTLTEPIVQEWVGITAWGRWPLTIHAAGWGILVNFAVAIGVSLVTRDDRARKMEFHDVLRARVRLRPDKRRLIPVAWAVAILWFCFAVGPGAVIGNTLFGDPNAPETWLFGMPSIWIWQILGWATGVAMMWFLAYRMELSTAPEEVTAEEVTAPPVEAPPETPAPVAADETVPNKHVAQP